MINHPATNDNDCSNMFPQTFKQTLPNSQLPDIPSRLNLFIDGWKSSCCILWFSLEHLSPPVMNRRDGWWRRETFKTSNTWENLWFLHEENIDSTYYIVMCHRTEICDVWDCGLSQETRGLSGTGQWCEVSCRASDWSIIRSLGLWLVRWECDISRLWSPGPGHILLTWGDQEISRVSHPISSLTHLYSDLRCSCSCLPRDTSARKNVLSVFSPN